MLFQRKLKTPMTPEDYVNLLNQGNFTGDKFHIVVPNIPGITGIVTFTNCDNPRFAVAVALYPVKRNLITHTAAVLHNISNADGLAKDIAIGSALSSTFGIAGDIVSNIQYTKGKKEAKALCKTTQKELTAFLDAQGL